MGQKKIGVRRKSKVSNYVTRFTISVVMATNKEVSNWGKKDRKIIFGSTLQGTRCEKRSDYNHKWHVTCHIVSKKRFFDPFFWSRNVYVLTVQIFLKIFRKLSISFQFLHPCVKKIVCEKEIWTQQTLSWFKEWIKIWRKKFEKKYIVLFCC